MRSTEAAPPGHPSQTRDDAPLHAAAFLLHDAVVAPPRLAPQLIAMGLGLAASGLLILAAGVRSPALAAVLCVVVAAVATLVVRLREATRAAHQSVAPPRVVLDATSLVFQAGSESTGKYDAKLILRADRPFGATLLTSPSRDLLVLALTHRDGVEYLAGRAPSGRRHLDLLARAVTTPECDLPTTEAIPTFVSGDRLLDLVAALESAAPGCLDRVFLSDAGMADLVLDDRRLRAGELDFDLRAPVQWRAYSFQEGSTFAANCYQATQIRQGEREIVLVSLATTGELATPSLISPPPGAAHLGPLAFEPVQRALARDLRLARGLAELPPPRAQRVAVDRLFMPRLRHALDLAPSSDVLVAPAARLTTPTPTPERILTPAEGIERLRQSRP